MRQITHTIRKAGLNALYLSGAHSLMAPYTRGVGVVLMLHHVRPDRSGDYAPHRHLEVTPEFLDAAIKRVRSHGIDIIPIGEARARLAEPGDRRFCVVTFDDGYRDNLRYAHPVLKALDCPFTVYVATGLVDRTADLWWKVVERVIEEQESVAVEMGGPVTYFPCRTAKEKFTACDRICDWLFTVEEDRQRAIVRELAWRYAVDPRAILDEEMMTWDEVRELASDPLVTIGGHTVGHHQLSKLPPERARAEIRDGARVLEAGLGQRPRHFAYPYGFASAAGEREFRMVAELGFETGVTTRPGVLSAGHSARPTAWPRVSLNGHYQSLHYVDLFLSGAAYAIHDRLRSIAAVRPRRQAVTVSASSR